MALQFIGPDTSADTSLQVMVLADDPVGTNNACTKADERVEELLITWLIVFDVKL